ncbi:helix-turn-helix transcriptional regulator [Adlercreutzia sp. R25]|uniref:response regulator transcription factor n=1 Tax=Adlercreutzia shanghongiae TaxID=3111773 RepID=UPI002DB8D095|nr:helix-turn-helix transcriptional regulator [Adlercreutzia sp. R25]MEC4271866.1 helix-turn-helix transcriptional regulator [Adlercreutzia sp. R25]
MPELNTSFKPWKEHVFVGASLGCLFIYEEMICSGLMLAETALSSVMYPLYCLIQAAAFLPLLVAPRIIGRAKPLPLSLASGLCMTAGAISAATSAYGMPQPFALAFAGFLLAAVGPALLKPVILLRMAHFSLSTIKLIVFGAFLSRFLAMLLPMLLPASADVLVITLGPLAALLWVLSRRCTADTPPITVRVSIASSALVPVAAAFIILTVGCTALSPLSVDPSFSFVGSGPFGGVTGWVVTQSIAAVIICVLLFGIHDLVYAVAAKTVGTAAILAFVVFMGAGAIMVSWDVSLVALNLLMFIPLVALVDFASYAAFKAERVVVGYLFAYEVSVAAGSLLGLAETGLSPLFGTVTILGLALCCLVVIAVVWLATEKNMDRFFWGQPLGLKQMTPLQEQSAAELSPTEPVSSPTSDIRATAEAVAADCGLTARETDVLELLTRGRSATFIAEELCLSPNTVRTHVSRIYTKCGVHSKQELLTLAQSHEA